MAHFLNVSALLLFGLIQLSTGEVFGSGKDLKQVDGYFKQQKKEA